MLNPKENYPEFREDNQIASVEIESVNTQAIQILKEQEMPVSLRPIGNDSSCQLTRNTDFINSKTQTGKRIATQY